MNDIKRIDKGYITRPKGEVLNATYEDETVMTFLDVVENEDKDGVDEVDDLLEFYNPFFCCYVITLSYQCCRILKTRSYHHS